MRWKVLCSTLGILVAVAASPLAHAQLRPQTTAPPEKKPAAKSAQIAVETLPNARVYLDDIFKGEASPEGRLVIDDPKPGAHKLRVSLEGKQNFEKNITVEAAKTAVVKAALVDLPGDILVRSSPGAEVYLDNSERGSTGSNGELALSGIVPGSHELRVSAPGKKDYQLQVSVAAGREAVAQAPLEDKFLTVEEEEKEADRAEQRGELTEALRLYVKALQASPKGPLLESDLSLRERIASLGARMKPPPAIPEDARRHFAYAGTAVKDAKGPSDLDNSIDEFTEAVRLAPWWPDANFNVGVLLEKRERYAEAARYLKIYLIAAPSASDAQTVQQKIYELEYKAKQASANKP
jgi:tetratricopeptide (TPR) repeat protein